MKLSSRLAGAATVCAAAWTTLASPAGAQGKKEADYLGSPSCAKATTACHKKPTNQWKTIEPQTIGADAHFNTNTRLTSDEKSKQYLAKLKWSPEDKRCTECHATVVPNLATGKPLGGVSCESCHGGGKGYIDVHAEIPDRPPAYDESVTAGLAELRKGPKVIAQTCARCHVISNREVLGTGHPDGSKWDADKALAKIVHWDKRPHSGAELKVAVDAIKATKLKGGPPVAIETKPPDTQPAGGPGPKPTATAQPAAKLEEIPELPEGYEDKPVAPAPKKTPAPQREPKPPPPPEVVKQKVSPVADEPTSLASTSGPSGEVQPVGSGAAGISGGWDVATPLSKIAALRRDVVSLVLKLLELKAQGKVDGSRLPAAPASAEYNGPDGELLRLQDEILRLSLEALRKEKP